MKTGFTTMATPGMSLKEIFAAAKEHNFDSVDLRVHKDGEIKMDLSYEEGEKIRKKASTIELFGLLCYNSLITDGEEAMIKSVLNCINVAEITGAKAIRIFSGKSEPEKLFEGMYTVLKKVFEIYKGKVNVLFQNHSKGEVTPLQAVKLAEKLNDERYGFIFSPDCSVKNGEEFIENLKEISEVTKQIYITDINKDGKYCYIGEGIVPLKEIIEKMIVYGFDGYLTLKWEKCWCEYLPPYQEGFRSFDVFLKSIF